MVTNLKSCSTDAHCPANFRVGQVTEVPPTLRHEEEQGPS